MLASIPFDSRRLLQLAAHPGNRRADSGGRETPELEEAPEFEEVRPSRELAPAQEIEAWLKRIANPWAEANQADARFLGGERFADFDARGAPDL